jgi:hypothetical protein
MYLYPPEKRIKCCWICGKDISLEHSRTDEHGISVHQSCHDKRMLLKAASAQLELWKSAQPTRVA